MDYWPNLLDFLQILLIDISLAGDNAIAVGMAAAGLPEVKRRQAVLVGIIAATVMRIVFAIFAVQLLEVTGLLVAGGLLLLWVAWKMYREIHHVKAMQQAAESIDSSKHKRPSHPAKKMSSAIWQIVIADVSMSLDNVLAVAGVARDHLVTLIIGLALSVILMGTAASLVARLTTRYPWVAYLGIAIVLYTALHMIWDGSKQFLPALA